ncbi:MAG: hypothetical protein Q7U14_10690 [Lacisediminimonas sp.]|nr:hypothetical protein [Lacisediminimonas sp.]
MSYFRNRSKQALPLDVQQSTGWSMLRTLLGILWALPLTLCGLLLAVPIMLAGGQLCVVWAATPALLVSGRFADYLLERHPFGSMCAMAVGHIVIADRQSLTPQILTHELAHVHQAALWGGLFPFAYCVASLWAVMRGEDAYWSNAFEVAARRAERHA